jgi:outer membrane protein OmpA-like peptidoglycan-associated protein
MGTVANNGCPEPVVTAEVQKSLNEYAKTILFTTGKSTLIDSSTPVLVDIISILNEYPNANFTIEGHTDSIGSETTNQKLSESRAQAVLEFLIKGGISPSRLTAIGYGESKPIATNMYKDGRQQNRRVEINLVE